jgi:hypothetical protein
MSAPPALTIPSESSTETVRLGDCTSTMGSGVPFGVIFTVLPLSGYVSASPTTTTAHLMLTRSGSVLSSPPSVVSVVVSATYT